MSDSPELAAIRARDGYSDNDLVLAAGDRRALLRMLDQALARIEFAATALDVKDRRVDELKKSRDVARDEVNELCAKLYEVRAEVMKLQSVLRDIYARSPAEWSDERWAAWCEQIAELVPDVADSGSKP